MANMKYENKLGCVALNDINSTINSAQNADAFECIFFEKDIF